MKHISEIIKEGKTAIICEIPEELANAYLRICDINNLERALSYTDVRNKYWDKSRCIDTTDGEIHNFFYFIHNGYDTINYCDVDFSEIAKSNTEDQPKPIQIKESHNKFIEIKINEDIEGERAISLIRIKDIQCVTYSESDEKLRISCGGITTETECDYNKALEIINQVKFQ